MEEEGDPKLLMFPIMEYERESSRTEYDMLPNSSELGEEVFIVQVEIEPLPLATSAKESTEPADRTPHRTSR